MLTPLKLHFYIVKLGVYLQGYTLFLVRLNNVHGDLFYFPRRRRRRWRWRCRRHPQMFKFSFKF